MTDREHRLLVRGATFAAVGAGGDIRGVPGGTTPDGLFVRDARHLSRWQLTVDGAVPEVLTPATAYGRADDADADADVARCVLVPRGGRQEPPAYTLFREQAVVDGSLVEALRITSNRPVPTTLLLGLTVDAEGGIWVCLVQTGKIDHFPVILWGSDYWKPMIDWLQDPVAQEGMIAKQDLRLFHRPVHRAVALHFTLLAPLPL